MRLGLTKPGVSAALRNPFAGFGDLGFSDDPDDPTFTGGGGGSGGNRWESKDKGSEDDEDDDEDEDEESKPSSKKSKGRASSKDDDEDDDDDDEDDPKFKAARQAKRYRLRLRETERERDELRERIQRLEDKDKPETEVVSRELKSARSEVAKLTETNRAMTAQLAFFRTPVGLNWVDPTDVFALADREGLFDDVIDEDGTVDARELRRGLKDLAKRKPYLVKKSEDDPKARGRKDVETDDDDEEDDEEPRSSKPMNGTRRGKRATGPSRAELAKRFPVLNRR